MKNFIIVNLKKLVKDKKIVQTIFFREKINSIKKVTSVIK